MTRRKVTKQQARAWTPMRRMHDQEEREDFQAMLQGNPGQAWTNDRYFAVAEHFGDQPTQAHVMIRRHDRQPVHSWTDLQRIKNEILGPEVEAIELYPAESRLVDTGNTYHLWAVFGARLPFGYQTVTGNGPATPHARRSPHERVRPRDRDRRQPRRRPAPARRRGQRGRDRLPAARGVPRLVPEHARRLRPAPRGGRPSSLTPNRAG